MNYANCHSASRRRANVVNTGLPGLLNLFLDELPAMNSKVFGGNVNIFETGSNFNIEVALPGFEKNDFKVQVDGEYLTISAEKTTDAPVIEPSAENPDRRYIRREFTHSKSFKRTFTLPEQANTSAINAQYNNGILHVTIAKKAVAEPTVQHIEVV